MGFLKGRDTDSGAKTQIYVGGSKTVLGFAYQAKRRNRVVMIGAGVGVVIAATTALGVMKYLEAAAAGRVVENYGALTQCFLGEPPTEGTAPSRRFRAIQLTALTQSDITRATDKLGPWPDRCGKFAHGLHESLGESAIGDTKGKALGEASKALADAIDAKESHWRDLSAALDRTFEEARRAGVILKSRPDVPPPPPPSTALTIDGLTKEGALTDRAVGLSEVRVQSSTDDAVRLLVDDPKGGARIACTITLEAASCKPLGKDAAGARGALRLDASAEPGSDVIALGSEAYFASDGTKLGDGAALSAHGNGATTTVLLEGKLGLELAVHESGRTRRVPVTLPGMTPVHAQQSARLLWGQLALLASSGKDVVLAAGPVGAGGSARVATVGVLPKFPTEGEQKGHLEGCRAGGETVIRARSGREEYVSFLRLGAWSPPLKMATSGGALQCVPGAALSTHVEGGTGEASLDAKLMVQRCTPTKCESHSLALRDFYAGELGLAASTPLGVTQVDGKLAVVWQAGQRGGLRLRVGSLDGLAATPDTIVFDDLVRDGRVVDGSSILDMKLLRAERFALLLLATPVGLRALRVTADGKAIPVKL